MECFRDLDHALTRRLQSKIMSKSKSKSMSMSVLKLDPGGFPDNGGLSDE
jgi:hypothetical protein